jgi:hypothetical protein
MRTRTALMIGQNPPVNLHKRLNSVEAGNTSRRGFTKDGFLCWWLCWFLFGVFQEVRQVAWNGSEGRKSSF